MYKYKKNLVKGTYYTSFDCKNPRLKMSNKIK